MVMTRKVVGIALALSLLWAAPATAGKPDDGPPGPGGRDVITDAIGICFDEEGLKPTDEDLLEACRIFDETAALTVEGNRNNADQNLDALLRAAASAVLSLDDVVNFGKVAQKATAASYLCSYADKIVELTNRGKIALEPAAGLATRARTLAGALDEFAACALDA